MGSFLTNYQIRSDSASAVREALAGLAKSGACGSRARNGWVIVYQRLKSASERRQGGSPKGNL
jgi:hypothetical protein